MLSAKHIRQAATERMRRWRAKRNQPEVRTAKKAQQRLDNFWAKVQKTEACWLWTACHDYKGYGRFGIGGRKSIGAHRYSWQIAYGPVPHGMQVLHRCDTPACVRPDHLFLGTALDNAIDRDNKLRGIQGSRNQNARLSEETVAEIRAIGNSAKRIDLAKRFGVGPSTIRRALRGESWRHVDV